VPAAAVIPAPIAYIQVVAIKTRVVEFRPWLRGLDASSTLLRLGLSFWGTNLLFTEWVRDPGLLL
jgi:purine nucleoside permease